MREAIMGRKYLFSNPNFVKLIIMLNWCINLPLSGVFMHMYIVFCKYCITHKVVVIPIYFIWSLILNYQDQGI